MQQRVQFSCVPLSASDHSSRGCLAIPLQINKQNIYKTAKKSQLFRDVVGQYYLKGTNLTLLILCKALSLQE